MKKQNQAKDSITPTLIEENANTKATNKFSESRNNRKSNSIKKASSPNNMFNFNYGGLGPNFNNDWVQKSL